MLMRGDIQKIIDQINPILEGLAARVEAIEKHLEAQKEPPKAKKATKAK